ncbi:MAG TPA: hypothetical protein VM099_14530 [Gemmatimonadaceae bacterium]|nr:hypothetical protein [Gemmatimonadaceae bacterium]
MPRQIQLASCLAIFWAQSLVVAQGVGTSGIRGTVHADQPGVSTETRIRVTRTMSGFVTEVIASHGRFLVEGLEPGGPYTIEVRQLGFAPIRRDRLYLALGELLEIDFTLHPESVRLQTVDVVATPIANGGTSTIIGESLLHSLPSFNRDFYEFVRLVPQVSTKIALPSPGFSAGGVGFRFNNFLINGASERTAGGSVSTSFGGGKSIPLDAVQEYQVLLSPYDVRYGDFTGGLVNTVTKSGTNQLTGSAFAFGRSDRLARASVTADGTSYDRAQYGFSIGGALVRDRVHFFFAPEFQHFTFPAAGPYVGQPQNSSVPVPVGPADLAQLTNILSKYGLEAGSSARVENGNPLRNVFSRIDVALPGWNSRAVVWNNYRGSDDVSFSRAARDTFSLSTYQVTRRSSGTQTAFQLHTTLVRGGGGHNEVLLSRRSEAMISKGNVDQPIVRVSVPATAGGRTTLNTGTHEAAQGTGVNAITISLKDNISLPIGAAHVLTAGADAERIRIQRKGIINAYGTWTFASLDDFASGVADRYEVGVDLGSATVPLHATQYAAYLSDQWSPFASLSVTTGLRADLLAIDGHAPYSGGIDSIFGRRTDQTPRRRVELSPRVGFIWDVASRQRIRGGFGIFATRFPLAWAHTALSSYGAGTALLTCGRSPSDAGPTPAFHADHATPLLTCGNGVGVSSSMRGDVDLLDGDLRMMRVARASLAFEQKLQSDVRFTGEALVTRALSDFAFVNVNLREPASTDRNGRTMYGTIAPTGLATPDRISGFSEVIDLRNTSAGRSYELTSRIEKDFSRNVTGLFSYTFSKVRDAMTPLRVNTRGTTAWASSRVLSGRQDDFTPGISSDDVPHRVVLAGSYSTLRRWKSELSFYYLGESGRPFTYIAFGSLRRGDLNADGTNTNDPVYVPANALDVNEIKFDGNAESVALQQDRFEKLVAQTSCLRRQQGKILERNTCREPWSNTTVASLKQRIPFGERSIEAQLDIFNVLNLLNTRWGIRREAVSTLLEHVGQTAGTVETSQPVFHFNPDFSQWNDNATESVFQLQLALRYRF